jgi:hypothetical protein
MECRIWDRVQDLVTKGRQTGLWVWKLRAQNLRDCDLVEHLEIDCRGGQQGCAV